jgi:hypothetical protein
MRVQYAREAHMGRDLYQMFGVEDRRRAVTRPRVPVDMLSERCRQMDEKLRRMLRDERIAAKARAAWGGSTLFWDMFGRRLLRDIEAWNAVREVFDRAQERRGRNGP